MITPIYKIASDGKDLAAAARQRLLSLSLVDSTGLESDSCEATFDDSGSVIELPRQGVQLQVSIGYQETGLRIMGLYTVDEVELNTPPQTMTIRAHAADFRQSLKDTKSRSWHDTTLGAVVETIAQEHGYIPRITEALAAIEVEHLDQTSESDIHLLTRLALQHGARVKPTHGFLVVAAKGSLKSTTGRALPSIALTAQELTSCRVTLPERGKYNAVTAHYHDLDGATRISVTAGSGTPSFAIGRTYASANQALSAAEAKLKSFKRGTGTLSLTLPGRPELVAESAVVLSGVRPGADGTWTISRVEHTLDSTGFVSQVEAEVPTP